MAEYLLIRFDRADGWQGASFSGSDAALPLPALGPASRASSDSIRC